jgi:hypothetical protein
MAKKNVALHAEAKTWMEMLVQHGAIRVKKGQFEFNPEVRKLVEAMHVVLAGGSVEVSIKSLGDATLLSDLQSAMQTAVATSVSAAKGPDLYV